MKFTDKEVKFYSIITAITYQDEKILRRESTGESLNYDPSDNQEWSWADFR